MPQAEVLISCLKGCGQVDEKAVVQTVGDASPEITCSAIPVGSWNRKWDETDIFHGFYMLL